MRNNGYNTAAFGKWHLTPDDQQGPAGPFRRWPNGLGFDYFWGFLGGETSQYDPVITENSTVLGVPDGDDYYFPDAMADKTIDWIHGQKSQDPDKPFFIYFATGASHAPHHIATQWADKYKGKFDAGWDTLRVQTFERQKKLGVIPPDAQLTPRNEAMPAWDGLSPEEKQLFTRQMEVYAGFLENADCNIGRVVEAIEDIGLLENTLIVYILGDNGSSLEGTNTGSFNELTMQNGIVLTPNSSSRSSASTADSRRGAVPTSIRTSPPLGLGPEIRRSSGASKWRRISAAPATRWSFRGRSALATKAACARSLLT